MLNKGLLNERMKDLIPIAISGNKHSIFPPFMNAQGDRKIVENHSVTSPWQRRDLNPELCDFMVALCSRLFRQLRKRAYIQE